MNNKVYYCHLCNHPYADSAFTTLKGVRYDPIAPQHNCTQDDTCLGQGFGGLCLPSGKTQADILKEEQMSNKVYYCHLCNHLYADFGFTTLKGVRYDPIAPQHNCTQDDTCLGQGFGGLCLPSGKTQADILEEESQYLVKRTLGLYVCLMDASGSMGDAAFEPNFPSPLGVDEHINNSPCEKRNQMSKRELMAANVALTIFSFNHYINLRENAFVSIILYDHNTKYLFLKSVKSIVEEYRDSRTLAKYLLKETKELNGGTNINGALKLATSLVEKFKAGTIEALGSFKPEMQTYRQNFDISTGMRIHSSLLPNMPNIRVLLYTNGEHQAKYGVLQRPVESYVPDFLIGVYIGQTGQRGDKELSKIVKYCPIHGKQQYFRVSNPQDSGRLHGIFRMVGAASGFCSQCVEGNGSNKTSVMS